MEKLNRILSSPRTGPRVLLGCTGSVATIKVPMIAYLLQQKGASVVIIPTKTALHFLLNSEEIKTELCDEKYLNIAPMKTLKGGASEQDEIIYNNKDMLCSNCSEKIEDNCVLSLVQNKYPELTFIDDSLEWSIWQNRGDPVLHIDLRKWADIFLIAPLSANSLSKLANGLCDNLLTCIVRAWDFSKLLLFCPAMNTHMHEHPFTAKHVNILKELGYREIPTVRKILMCGDVGLGAMAEISTIVDAVEGAMHPLFTDGRK